MTLTLNQWKPRVEPHPFAPVYLKDRYGIKAMEVGDESFVSGAIQKEITPYTTYENKKGAKKFVTARGEKDGIKGVMIRRDK